MDKILTENYSKSEFKWNGRIRSFVQIAELSDFKQFKTETYVYWRFNLIICKENAVMRSLREKNYLK